MIKHSINYFFSLFYFSALILLAGCQEQTVKEPLPDIYKQQGAFIQSLPYFNPDSCVLLIKEKVPPQWQGVVYENLILDGPEDSSVELGFKHLDYYEKNFPADTATIFTQLWRGTFNSYIEKYDSTHVLIQSSYDLSMKIGDYLRAGDAKSRMTLMYLNEGQTAQAIRSGLAAYEALGHLDSTQAIRKYDAANTLAIAYNQSTDWREAVNWINRALVFVNDENNPVYHAYKVNAYDNASKYYRKLDLLDSAIIVSKRAIELQEKYQTYNNKSKLLTSLGMAYYAKGECPRALKYLQTSLKNLEGAPTVARIEIEKDLADIYLCLMQLDSAEWYYQRELISTTPMNIYHANKGLSEVYAQQGKYQLAFEANQKSADLREKYFSTKIMQETGAAKAELKLEQERHYTAELSQTLKIKQQRIWLISLLGLVGLIIAAFLIFRQRSRRIIIEQEKELVESREILHLQELANKTKKLKHTEVKLSSTKDALHISKETLLIKNKLIEDLEMRVSTLEKEPSAEPIQPPSNMLSFEDLRILTKEEWILFKIKFDELFPDYLAMLKEKHPTLSPAEKRLFLLIKSGFDSSEMADILGIAQQSIWRNRIRLAKKLNLENTKALDEFILKF